MAEESNTLFRIVLFLGVVFLLIAALSPGADAAWSTFSASMQNFPEFNNPFDAEEARLNFPLLPNSRGHADPTGFDTDLRTGCASNFVCVRDFNGTDSGSSFVTIKNHPGDFLDAQLQLDLEGPHVGRLRRLYVDVWCRTTNITLDTTPLSIRIISVNQFDTGTVAYVSAGLGFQWLACPILEFKRVTVQSDVDAWSNLASREQTPMVILQYKESSGQSNGRVVEISTIRASGEFSSETGCTTSDFFSNTACQIGRIFDTVTKVVLFLINGVIFVGEVIAWFLGIIVSFISMFAYFLAIPGAPPIIQGIVTLIVVSMILFIGFVFLKVARGSGTTG